LKERKNTKNKLGRNNVINGQKKENTKSAIVNGETEKIQSNSFVLHLCEYRQ